MAKLWEGMTGGGFCYPGRAHGFLEGALQGLFVKVVATLNARARIARSLQSGKYILPAPLSTGVGIFALQGKWQVDVTETFAQVLLMQDFDIGQVCPQRFDQGDVVKSKRTRR